MWSTDLSKSPWPPLNWPLWLNNNWLCDLSLNELILWFIVSIYMTKIKDSCGGRCGQLLVLTWHTVFRRDDKTLSNFFIIATTEIINVIIIIPMTMISHQLLVWALPPSYIFNQGSSKFVCAHAATRATWWPKWRYLGSIWELSMDYSFTKCCHDHHQAVIIWLYCKLRNIFLENFPAANWF